MLSHHYTVGLRHWHVLPDAGDLFIVSSLIGSFQAEYGSHTEFNEDLGDFSSYFYLGTAVYLS